MLTYAALDIEQFGSYFYNLGVRFGSDWWRVGWGFVAVAISIALLIRTWKTWYGRIFTFLALLGSFWLGWSLFNRWGRPKNNYALTGKNTLIDQPSDLFARGGATIGGIALAIFFMTIAVNWYHARKVENRLGKRDILCGLLTGVGSIVVINFLYGVSRL